MVKYYETFVFGKVEEMVFRAKRTSENIAVSLMAGLLFYWLYAIFVSEIEFKNSIVKMLVAIAFSVLFQAVPAVVFTNMQRAAKFEKIETKSAPNGSAKYNILLAFAGFELIFIFGLLYSAAFPMATVSYANDGVIMTILSVIKCAVVPAVCEEFLYRKLFCRELTVFGSTFAVIGSSLLFGLAHYSYYTFPYAFICGFVLGFVYIKTGSVRYTVGIHFMNNLITYILSRVSSGMEYISYTRLMMMILVIMFVLLLVVLRMLAPNISKRFSNGDYGNVASSAFLTFSMILFIASAVIMNFI